MHLQKTTRSYSRWVNGTRKTVAQQFTINGFTYPFVQELNFAGLPYPRDRKYSMLLGFLAPELGILCSSPIRSTMADGGINSRRGLRGIFRVVSKPFADNLPINASTGYTLLGEYQRAIHTTLTYLRNA